MKKVVTLCLFGLIVLAFGATVYAQAPKVEFKASGFIDMNTFWYRNVETTEGSGNNIFGPRDSTVNVPTGGGFNKSTNNWTNARGRLKFDFVTGKELSGTVFLEMDADRWGGTDGTRNKYGFWTADRAAIEIKHVYFDVALPYVGIPVPITVRIGQQPLLVRPNIVMNNDGTGILAAAKLDPVTITGAWAKAVEGKDAAADDSTAYYLKADVNLGKLTVGGYGLLFNMNTYPFNTQTTSYGTDPSYKAKMWWFGAYAQGKVGPFDLVSDIVMDTGKVEPFGTQVGQRKVDYRGWMGLVKVTYPWEKYAVSASLMYASGADARKTSSNGLPGSVVGHGGAPYTAKSSKVNSYVIPPGDEADFNGFDGCGIFYGSPIVSNAPHWSQGDGNIMNRGAPGGTWYARLGVSSMIFPWYKMTLAGMYIGDTTKNGNTVGSAIKSNGYLRDDKTIGWEIGLMNEIAVYKSLAWNVQLSYLKAGKATDQYNTATGHNIEMRDPWLIGTRVIYSF